MNRTGLVATLMVVGIAACAAGAFLWLGVAAALIVLGVLLVCLSLLMGWT